MVPCQHNFLKRDRHCLLAATHRSRRTSSPSFLLSGGEPSARSLVRRIRRHASNTGFRCLLLCMHVERGALSCRRSPVERAGRGQKLRGHSARRGSASGCTLPCTVNEWAIKKDRPVCQPHAGVLFPPVPGLFPLRSIPRPRHTLLTTNKHLLASLCMVEAT